MPITLDATVGGPAANSYETSADADNYFSTRLPLSGWTSPPAGVTKDMLLMMATRVLDALAQPFKTFFPAEGGAPAYYRVRRQWQGLPASATQRLAWPRIGLHDMNGNPLDFVITGITAAAAAVVTTNVPHRQTGSATQVLITGTDSTPVLDGPQIITVLSPTTFSVPVLTTVAGTKGGVAIMPQELKDALAEFAGQLGSADRTLDNDVIVQGITAIKAGSVSLNFKNAIIPQVVPDAVYNLMPQEWLTDELYVLANQAIFDVVTRNPSRLGDRPESEGWF